MREFFSLFVSTATVAKTTTTITAATATTATALAATTTATVVEQQAWIIFKRFEIYDGFAKEVAGGWSFKILSGARKKIWLRIGACPSIETRLLSKIYLLLGALKRILRYLRRHNLILFYTQLRANLN